MRIRRLDLIRYGRFTDVTLDLPEADQDFHIVYGPNEAGKSTTLSAVEDFLFGVPPRTTLDFVHQKSALRVGASLQTQGALFEARRRKGNKDTLLTADDLPMSGGDSLLGDLLAGADREFFARMFCLDHVRLHQGGNDLLEGGSDSGQAIFGASAGIVGLREAMAGLESEADNLFKPTRSKSRKFYQADDKRRAAEAAIREHTVLAKKWQELKRDYDEANEVAVAIEKEIEAKTAQLSKLSRIRRVYGDVRKEAELSAELERLKDVASFPEGALEQLQRAEAVDGKTRARIEALQEQLKALLEEHEGLKFDENILHQADEIAQLHRRRIEVQKGRNDLPKRREELTQAESDVRNRARQLGWSADEIESVVANLPGRSDVTKVRSVLARGGTLQATVDSTRSSLGEAEARLAQIARQLGALGEKKDVSVLAALVKTYKARGDTAGRIANAQAEAAKAQNSMERLLKTLTPVPDFDGSDTPEMAEQLVTMRPPSQSRIQDHLNRRRDLDSRVEKCRESRRTTQQAIASHQSAHETVIRRDKVVSAEKLDRAREYRNAGWSLIKRRFVDNVPSSPEFEREQRAFSNVSGSLPTSFEGAVRRADELADNRFERVEGAARLAEIGRQLDEAQRELAQLEENHQSLAEQCQQLDKEWMAMWADAPVAPLAADLMLEWMACREAIGEELKSRETAVRLVRTLTAADAEAADRLRDPLSFMGVKGVALDQLPLASILELAGDCVTAQEQTNRRLAELVEAEQRESDDAAAKGAKVKEAEEAWVAWQREWSEVLSSVKLPHSMEFAAVEEQLVMIEEVRQLAASAQELLNKRIATIDRDIAAFSKNMAEMVGDVAPDLRQEDADKAGLELDRRLAEAREISNQATNKLTSADGLQEKLRQEEESRRDALETIGALKRVAGVETTEELKIAITRSNEQRRIQGERDQLIATLHKQGDGLALAALVAACAEVDIDQATAQEGSLEHERKELLHSQRRADEERTQKKQAFEAIGGSDGAASAAADRQAALSELTEVCEQYVRVRSSAILLRWAIEKFRQDNQAPLLKRASQLFTTLTGGSFSDLRPEYDDNDNVQLAGERPDGSRVSLTGMSTGTADQLYLALRVASVESYLERGNPMPFIADDLFIHFDDTRAVAGFKVLGELARKTQVLFFTHHQHLTDVAREALGPSVPLIELVPGAKSRS